MKCNNSESPNFCGILKFGRGIVGPELCLNTEKIQMYFPYDTNWNVINDNDVFISHGAKIKMDDGSWFNDLADDRRGLGRLLPFDIIHKAILTAQKNGTATLEFCRPMQRSSNPLKEISVLLTKYINGENTDLDKIVRIVEE